MLRETGVGGIRAIRAIRGCQEERSPTTLRDETQPLRGVSRHEIAVSGNLANIIVLRCGSYRDDTVAVKRTLRPVACNLPFAPGVGRLEEFGLSHVLGIRMRRR